MDILMFSNGKADSSQGLLQYGYKELERQVKENNIKEYLMIPYAVIRSTYEQRVADMEATLKPLGVRVKSITDFKDPIKAIEECQAIAVSGGNTWYMIRQLHDLGLIEPIKKAVLKDSKAYVGWSAGCIIGCPTMATTNDMPIMNVLTTSALGFVPFQINAHYTDFKVPGHMGESRDDRLEEYLAKNQHKTIVGLREASWLKIINGNLTFESQRGDKLKIFNYGKPAYEIDSTANLQFLMDL